MEIAGELVVNYPNVETHLISSTLLLERTCSGAHSTVFKYFSSFKNMKLHLKEKVVEIKGRQITTDKGTVVDADVLFACIGFRPNTECFKQGMSHAIDKYGLLKVNQYFQVADYQHVFAGGDITNISEEKLAQNAEVYAMWMVL